MTIGGRIRIARRSFDLNQTEFGARVGLSQAAIAGYENDSHSVAEQTLIHICKEYRINEAWLRTGDGEMLDESGDDFLAELAAKYPLDPLEQAMMRAVYEMTPDQRRAVLAFARRLVDEYGTEPEESDDERTIRIVREGRAARDAEESQDADKRA